MGQDTESRQRLNLVQAGSISEMEGTPILISEEEVSARMREDRDALLTGFLNALVVECTGEKA